MKHFKVVESNDCEVEMTASELMKYIKDSGYGHWLLENKATNECRLVIIDACMVKMVDARDFNVTIVSTVDILLYEYTIHLWRYTQCDSLPELYEAVSKCLKMYII